jgi:hypothetical protein
MGLTAPDVLLVEDAVAPSGVHLILNCDADEDVA